MNWLAYYLPIILGTIISTLNIAFTHSEKNLLKHSSEFYFFRLYFFESSLFVHNSKTNQYWLFAMLCSLCIGVKLEQICFQSHVKKTKKLDALMAALVFFFYNKIYNLLQTRTLSKKDGWIYGLKNYGLKKLSNKSIFASFIIKLKEKNRIYVFTWFCYKIIKF